MRDLWGAAGGAWAQHARPALHPPGQVTLTSQQCALHMPSSGWSGRLAGLEAALSLLIQDSTGIGMVWRYLHVRSECPPPTVPQPQLLKEGGGGKGGIYMELVGEHRPSMHALQCTQLGR